MLVASLDRLPANAVALAGGKGASLGRMRQAGVSVPRGFVVLAEAFKAFLDAHDLMGPIQSFTRDLDVHDAEALDDIANAIQRALQSRDIPPDVRSAIVEAYDLAGGSFVAVRSSAVGEDGHTASFAGQQETFLNVRGEEQLLARVRDCWGSFFSGRALFYRAQKGGLSDLRMAVVVQEMVPADKSGVMFTVDPIEKRRDRMVIEAVFGLGEGIVSGMLTPDHYVLDRDDGSIVREFVAVQTTAITCDPDSGGVRHVTLTEDEGGARVLTDGEIGELRRAGLTLESCFGAPQDVEWCIKSGELLFLQSRPITTL